MNTPIDFLLWVKGPAFDVALTIFVLGIIVRLFEILLLGRRADFAQAKGLEVVREQAACTASPTPSSVGEPVGSSPPAPDIQEVIPGTSGELVYFISHNIARLEPLGGDRAWVHRKGATRAYGPGHPDIPEPLRSAGQPVLFTK